jgi:hypothetical protein
MRVLIACEFSGIVRDAFAKRGHDAWSCDLLPTESPGQHIQGDVLNFLGGKCPICDGRGWFLADFRHDHSSVCSLCRGAGTIKWDMMIAHPPCTYLTYAGMSKWDAPGRAELREEAMAFFLALYNAPIPRVAVENPRGYPSRVFRQPDDTVNPFDFGEAQRKRVCLWLKGLPPLMRGCHVDVKPAGSCVKKNGRRYNYYFHQGKNAKGRSRFFPGIANAMAKQWG